MSEAQDIRQFSSLDWVRKLPEFVRVSIGRSYGTLVLVLWSSRGENTLHCDVLLEEDVLRNGLPCEEFERRYIAPMLNNLLGALLVEEFGVDDVTASYRWEAEAAMDSLIKLGDHEREVIARRKALTAAAFGIGVV